MKKLLLAIAAVGALGAALPAMADPWDHDGGFGRGGYGDYGGRDGRYTRDGYNYRGYGDIDQRTRDISIRIEQGRRDGSLDWRETRGLRDQLGDIRRLEYRYRWDGLNGWERADLNARLDRLSYQVHDERRDHDYRW
ncbi:MAG TPA: hypothetical protein VF459_03610 [Caulobacteraceae bacterium]